MAINNDNIPTNRIGAIYALIGMKSVNVDLIERILNGEIKTLDQVSDYCWADIKEIDLRLED